MEWGEASAFARGGITTTSAPAPQSPLQTTTALRRTCTHGRGHETYLVAGNALVDEVVCELALDSARQASIFAAFVCHDLLQPHLLPVRGHSGSAVRQQGLAFALRVRAARQTTPSGARGHQGHGGD